MTLRSLDGDKSEKELNLLRVSPLQDGGASPTSVSRLRHQPLLYIMIRYENVVLIIHCLRLHVGEWPIDLNNREKATTISASFRLIHGREMKRRQ